MKSFAIFGVVASCLWLVGCASSDSNQPDGNKMSAEAPTATEMAAYSASHPYPTTQARDDMRVAAIISTDRSMLRLYNFTNTPLADVEVWVNGAWCHHIRGVSANSSVVVRTTDLYNAFGKNFSSQSEPVSRVQIRIGSDFYNCMGPVTQ